MLLFLLLLFQFTFAGQKPFSSITSRPSSFYIPFPTLSSALSGLSLNFSAPFLSVHQTLFFLIGLRGVLLLLLSLTFGVSFAFFLLLLASPYFSFIPALRAIPGFWCGPPFSFHSGPWRVVFGSSPCLLGPFSQPPSLF
jgi:hypothetical protein